MAEVALTAEARNELGSRPARRLRAAGKVPAILYGHGVEPQSLAVDARELRTALSHEAGLNALLALTIGDDRHLAMARQVQRHPVRRSVEHLDLVVVRRDEVVAVEVPIRLVGEPEAVNRVDGLVEQQAFSLLVNAMPGDIPSHLEIDVSKLKVGDTIRIADIKLPPGVTTDTEPEDPAVIATASSMAGEVEAADEAAAEAAAEEAAEGETPEGGDTGGESSGDGASEE